MSAPERLTREECFITDEIAFRNGADEMGETYTRFRDGDWSAVSPLTMIDWADLLDEFASTPVDTDINPGLPEFKKEVCRAQIKHDLLCRWHAFCASDKIRTAATMFPYDGRNPEARIDRSGNPV